MIRVHHGMTTVACLLSAVAAASCGNDAPTPPDPPLTSDVAVCEPSVGDGWSWTEVAEGTKPAMSVDEAGTPFVAFMSEDLQGWVRVSSIDPSTGNASDPTTFANGYFYGPIDIDALSGQIQVAYHDHDREDLVLARQSPGGAVELFPQQNPGHDGWHPAIKRDMQNGVHIASVDPSGFDGEGAFYSFFQDGTFEIELAIPGKFMYDGGLSIDVAPDGTVYVVVFDDVAGIAWLGRRSSSGSWGVQVVDSAATLLEVGRFPQIKIDNNSTLHLAYLARISASTGVIRYATGSFGALVVEDVVSVTDLDINMGLGARNMVDLDFMSDGTPVIAYQTTLETGIAWRGTSGWDLRERLPARPDVRLRQQVSIALFDDVINLTFWLGDLPGLVCYGRK